MKLKVLLLVGVVFLSIQSSVAQRAGAKIAYIDTDYILKNVPEYQKATSQLQSKVQKWKVEVDGKLNAIKQKREALNLEKALLTKELYDERLEDLFFEEKEIIEYQQKRFGPSGDLVIQRKQLMQPVQDQIFQAVQDISTKRKYDFVFDKSADVVMLYSAEKYDISDVVLRTITRASKRKQATSRKDRLEAEKDEIIEEEKSDSQIERQRVLEAKKAKRDSLYSAKREAQKIEREAQIEAKRKARQELLKEREAKRNKQNATEEKSSGNDDKSKLSPQEIRARELEAKKAKREAERLKRQQELEAKKKAIDESRKKAKEEKETKEEKED
jgi:Skp family chaperone for outer membrane proteins